MLHALERTGFCTEFWWGSEKERDHYDDVDVGGRIILKLVFAK
jgi:hypothetical protein